MDQGILSNIKHIYKSALLSHLVNTELNVLEFQKQFDLKDAIYAAALAWKDVKESTLQSCWHKLWPTVAGEQLDFEGFDDPDDIITDNVQRLQQLASQAPASHPIRDVDAAGMEEWLSREDEPTVQELTDKAIVAMLRTPSQTAEYESKGEEEEEKQKKRWKQAQEAFTTLLDFTRSSPYYNSSEVMKIQVLYNQFLQKKASSCKRADIRPLFARAAQRASVDVVDVDDLSPMPSPSGASSSPKPSTSGVSRALLYTSDSETSD